MWPHRWQDPPSLGFSRQEHWSGLPFPSPMHENEKENWSRSVVSDSSWPHGLQPTRLLHPWDFSRQEYWSGLPMPSLNYHITVYIFWPTDTGDSCLFFPLIFETKRNVIGYHLNKILVPDMKLQRSKVNILFPPYWRNRVIIFSLGKMQTDNKKKWRVQVSLYISWIIVLFCWKNKDKEGVERRF